MAHYQTSDLPNGGHQLDVTVQGVLELRIRGDGTVIWITTEDGTVFRACQIANLIVEDARPLRDRKNSYPSVELTDTDIVDSTERE
jgi:hypothetical protein